MQTQKEVRQTVNTPTYKMSIVLVLALLLSFFSVNAVPIDESNIDYVESRIYNTSDSYIINWSEDGNEYTVTDNNYYGLRRVLNNTFWLLELDSHLAQIIRVIDTDSNGQFTTIGITLIENPDNPNPTPTIPVRACVNGTTIRGGNRFRQEVEECDGEQEYYIGRVPFNVEFPIRFVEHPTPYIWWLGEGQGGGGDGIPTCNSVGASESRNATNGTIVYSYTYGGIMIPNQPAGCSGVSITFQTNQTGSWAVIPTTNTSDFLDCKGVSCIVLPAGLNTWYYRSIQCDKTELVHTRIRWRYRIGGTTFTSFSSVKEQYCYEPIIDEGNPNYFIPIIKQPREAIKKIWFLPIVLVLAGLSTYVVKERKKIK